MSQANHILHILKRDGYISNFRCIEEKITLRLAARINDLKKAGWEITSRKQPNKDCVYTLVKPYNEPGHMKVDDLVDSMRWAIGSTEIKLEPTLFKVSKNT